MGPVTEQEASLGEAEDDAFSPKDLALFAARCARKNLALCLLVAGVVLGMGTTIVAALPRYYESTCKIFVQDGAMVTSSLTSGRNDYRPTEAARGLQEFILARDNLLSIAREAQLYDTWPSTRAWPMQLKDGLIAALFGPPSRKDMERVFADMLSGLIAATTEGESVRITAQWRNRQNAFDIARLVQRNFLAARAAHEFGPLRRAIPFMEEQLKEADQAVEQAITRLQTSTPPPTKQEPKAKETKESAELAALSRQLAETRRRQRALNGPRRRRAAELKMELIDMRASYSADHPLVRQQEARIAAMEESPPELAQLRETESQLLASLSSFGVTPQPEQVSGITENPELALARAQLGIALRKADDIAGRLESTRIELATAEADFEHRYIVVEEAEIPDKPLKAKKKLMMFLGVLVAALVLAILAAVAIELRKGRLIEPWQVRALGVEVLGEVDLRKLLPRNNP